MKVKTCLGVFGDCGSLPRNRCADCQLARPWCIVAMCAFDWIKCSWIVAYVKAVKRRSAP